MTSNTSLTDVNLGSLVVVGDSERESEEKYQSGSFINQRIINDNPSGNGDITSLLKILPNVQYDNAQLKSTTPGEIDPANISISGGLFYQNNFQLDGFNMNNDLDPAGSMSSNPVAATALPGRSQGFNVDTSLLESINVQDSNISAAYGGFTGGVVEANTKRPTKQFGAKISYQISQGDARDDKFSLTKYHLYGDDSDLQSFINSASAGSQPNFIKHVFRSSFESKFSDSAGVIASFTTTQSFIPLNAYAGSQIDTTLDSKRKTQKRQSYNLFLKGYYDIGESVRFEASYGYMPSFNNYFIVNTKDSDFNLKTGGHQLGLKAVWDNNIGLLTAQTSYSLMDSSRSDSAQHMKGWRYSTDKNWNPSGSNSEGGYGNVDTLQHNFNLKINQEFKPLAMGILDNKVNAGIELGYMNASYQRDEDTLFSGSAFTRPMGQGQICTDLEWCSNGIVDISNLSTSLQTTWANNNGQYMYRATLYKAGKINVDNFTLGAYIENDMKFDFGNGGDLNARIGARLDYDTYMKKAPIAPRFSLNYTAPWSKWENGRNFATQFTFGANRYYGRNFFSYALMDGRSAFQYTLTRNNEATSWDSATATQNKNDTNFKTLKVPYADELMGGFAQQIYNFTLSAKYIHRFGRDDIRRMCQAPDGSLSTMNCASNSTLTSDLRYVYVNEGRSETDVVTLSLQNNTPLEFWGIKNYFLFAFDWTNVKRNFNDYSENISAGEYANEFISWGGQLIRYADRPAENFVRPYTIRLSTTHTFNLWRTKWTWNNFFRFRSGYTTMASTSNADRDQFLINGVMTPVATFKPFNIKGAFTWDMRIGFEIDVYKKNTLFVNLDILNVLDTLNVAIASASYSATAGTTAVPVYEVGRQFWLEVGYKF